MVQRWDRGEDGKSPLNNSFIFNLLRFKYIYITVYPFQITPTDNISIVKDGTYRKLIIKNCTEDDIGKYRCEADGRKTEAVLNVEGILESS